MKQDPVEFAKAIVALFGSWNRPMTNEAIDAYQLVLSDLPVEQIQEGVLKVCRAGGQHPPSAGDLRKICIGTDKDTVTAKAIEAHRKLDRMARTEGRAFNTRRMGRASRHAMGAIGGWEAFCSKTDEWQQRNFIAAYIEAASNTTLGELDRIAYRKPTSERNEALLEGVTKSLTIARTP